MVARERSVGREPSSWGLFFCGWLLVLIEVPEVML